MSSALHPITAQRLGEVVNRRRTLVWLRGAAAIVLALLLLTLAVVVIDAFWVLSNSTRIVLGLLIYFGLAAVTWTFLLRPGMRKVTAQDVARSIESLEPRLHQNLLAAIELSDQGRPENRGSATFLGLLQEQVASQMQTLDTRRILPLSLIGRWLKWSIGVAICFGGLWMIPSLELPQRVVRAWLPAANIGRLSKTRIVVVRPNPPSQRVPEHESIAVEVELPDSTIDEVWMETSTRSSGTQSTLMRSSAPHRFVANVPVAEDAVRYRFHAGDAVTEYNRFDPHPRPHVVSFSKRYRFPVYSQLAERTEESADGNLSGLVGTNVLLSVELNEEVREASLNFRDLGSSERHTAALTHVDGHRWEVELDLDRELEYQVHLVSALTGFDNPLSPKYSIRPVADLPPHVEMTDVGESQRLTPADGILRLEANVEDELPILRLEQEVSINGAEWIQILRSAEAPSPLNSRWDWDLLTHRLNVGDQVKTRLAATDRKSQVGYSQTVELLVGSAEMAPDRHRFVDLSCRLVPFFETFANTMAAMQEASKPILEELRKAKSDAGEAAAMRAKLRETSQQIIKQTAELKAEVDRVAGQISDPEDADELERIGRLLARIEEDWGSGTQVLLSETWLAIDDRERHVDHELVRRNLFQSFESAKELHNWYRVFVSHDVVLAMTKDLEFISRHQQQSLLPKLRENSLALSRHQTVTLRQLQELNRQGQRFHRYVRPDCARGLEHLRNNYLHRLIDRLAEGLAKNADLAKLQQIAEQTSKELVGQRGGDIDGGLRWVLPDSRRRLTAQSGSLTQDLNELSQAAKQVAEHQLTGVKRRETSDSEQFQKRAERLWDVMSELQLPKLKQFSIRRQLRQSNQEGEPVYASDLGLAERALQAVLKRQDASGATMRSIANDLPVIAHAFHTLEVGDILASAMARLRRLSLRERWKGQSFSARLEHGTQWSIIQIELEAMRQSVREAQFPQPTIESMDRLMGKPDLGEARRKFDDQNGQDGSWASAAGELDAISEETLRVLKEMDAHLQAAREVLRQFAPTLTELARKASEAVQQLKTATEKLAESAQIAASPLQFDESFESQQQQADANLQRLADAILEKANAEDLATAEGRQAAKNADKQLDELATATKLADTALDEAALVDKPQKQSEQLQEAADFQQQLLETLDQLKQQLESPLDSSAEMANPQASDAQRPQIAGGEQQQRQERYEQAEKLAKFAAADPRQMLRQLEESLKNSPEMKKALSEIAEQTAEESLASLRQAAKREDEFQRNLENADPELKDRKRELAEQLQDMSRSIAEAANQMLGPAAERAQQTKNKELHDRLREAQRIANELMNQTSQANPDRGLSDLQKIAEQVAKEATQIATQTQQDADQLREASKQKPSDLNDQQLKQRRQELENAQNQFRQSRIHTSQDRLNQAKQRKQQAEQQFQHQERQTKDRQRQVEQAKNQAEREPKNQGLQQQVRQAEANLETAKAEQQRSDTRRKSVERQLERQIQAHSAAQQDRLPNLDQPNVTAQLAEQLANRAVEVASKLAAEAMQLADEQPWKSQLQPVVGEVSSIAKQQSAVQNDVAQVAEDLARAGRHEQRLGNVRTSELLQVQAESVRQTADQDVAQATRRLADAGQPESNETDPRLPANSQQSIAAREATIQAEAAITAEVDALRQLLDSESQRPSADPFASKSGNSSPSERSQQSAANQKTSQAQQMAQLLDELDRAANDGEPSSSSETSGRQSLPTLGEATNALARSLRQSRTEQLTEMKSQASSNPANQSGSDTNPRPTGDFEVRTVERANDQWGLLRQQSVEDLTEANREGFPPEYRRLLEIYYRVIAERSQKP